MVRLYASPTHKAVVFSYNTEMIEGDTIDIKAVNADTGDVGTRTAPNVGTFVLFYPQDFTGTDDIFVTGSIGGEHSGHIDIP